MINCRHSFSTKKLKAPNFPNFPARKIGLELGNKTK